MPTKTDHSFPITYKVAVCRSLGVLFGPQEAATFVGLFGTYERSYISVALCYHLIGKCHVLTDKKKNKKGRQR